jgi:SpoVK/Ycf46/Vps4 family AAA+-type ATPase
MHCLGSAGALCIGIDELEAANKGFEPASCWGVGKMQSTEGPGPRGWQDVGGLEEVREALQEAMELPTKYAALVARCAGIGPCSDCA